MGLLVGACFALVAVLGVATAMRGSEGGLGAGGLGALFGVGAIILMPIVYGVIGLIGGAIAAALYNLFAGMFGGVEVEVEQ